MIYIYIIISYDIYIYIRQLCVCARVRATVSMSVSTGAGAGGELRAAGALYGVRPALRNSPCSKYHIFIIIIIIQRASSLFFVATQNTIYLSSLSLFKEHHRCCYFARPAARIKIVL